MGLFDNIVLGLLDLVEGKNKTQYMTEDEALNILLEGTAPIETLEKAEDSLKYHSMRTCRFTLCYLSDCLGALYGLNENKSGGTAIDYVFEFVRVVLDERTASEESCEGLKLMGEIFRRHPDFNREVNEFALNAQPDYKNYSGILPYLSLAHLYGWGYEPNVQEAEEYADKAEALEKNIITENLRARIEAVKNGQ
ncbi:MAG: hypothetical protein ACI4SX_07390 [Candidatus Fimenecus sp.]